MARMRSVAPLGSASISASWRGGLETYKCRLKGTTAWVGSATDHSSAERLVLLTGMTTGEDLGLEKRRAISGIASEGASTAVALD
jgi:hypothetical protein